jgi:hypothetical protein
MSSRSVPSISDLLAESGRSSRQRLHTESQSAQNPILPSLVDIDLDQLFPKTFSNLNSNDPKKIKQILSQIEFLYFPKIIAPIPSTDQLLQILEFQSSPDSSISMLATELLCFFFVTLPETQSFLFETNFHKSILNHLSSKSMIFRLLNLLKCSDSILHILESDNLIPRLLLLLNSTDDDSYFGFVLEVYGFLLSTAAPSAIAASESVVALISPLALAVDSDRQWSVLTFLRTAIHFCGNQLIENGIICGIVRNCLEFHDSQRSIALKLLADAANTEFVESLVNFGVISLVHHALEFCKDTVSILSVLSGVISSGLSNAKLVARLFVGGEIAEFFINGSYYEKIAASEVVLRMFEHVMNLEIAKYLESMPLIPQLVEMLESQFRPARRAILGSLLCLKGAADQGVLDRPLAEQFSGLLEDLECVAAIESLVVADDCEPEVRDMAIALLQTTWE